MSTTTAALVALSLTIPACVLDADDKGAEEAPLGAGKDDSFADPTEHGALSFTSHSGSSLTGTARFHAWTFTLTAAAALDLRIVSSTDGLDTVAYLYRRDPGAGAWGPYLAKNDDADGGSLSRIELADAAAGEYRLIVKGYTTEQAGPFGIDAGCTGAGCPGAAPAIGTLTCQSATLTSGTPIDLGLADFYDCWENDELCWSGVPASAQALAADLYDALWSGDRNLDDNRIEDGDILIVSTGEDGQLTATISPCP
jgi:hypothetical protein